MTRSPSVLRSALNLLSIRLVLKQIGLAFLIFVLCALWLRVPDASVIDVIGSALLALIVLAVAGCGETALILSLAGGTRTLGRLLRSALFLLAGLALWFAWSTLLNHLHGNDYLRAGYLNSRFPHSLRNFLSFAHIVRWLGWMWTALEWMGTGVIAIFAFAATASSQPRRFMSRALRCITYWIAVVLGTAVATLLSGSIMNWTPGHGLRVEMMSLVVRLSFTILADATVLCLLLAILAACVRSTDALYSAPAGTPDESHPRTVDNP